jgi:hypothetical protein
LDDQKEERACHLKEEGSQSEEEERKDQSRVEDSSGNLPVEGVDREVKAVD